MATSGSVYTGYQNYTRFYLIWSLSDQDITNNRSLISWEIGVQGTAGYTAYWYSNAVKINSAYVNGSLVSGAATYSNITLSGSTRHRLRSGSIWVGHNSDGTKTFSASVSGWLFNNGTRSASGSWALTTIPRNSQVSTNASSYDLGDAIGIITNRKSTSFTHTITIRLNNSSGTILQTIYNVGASTTWTPTSAQIETMQNAIPTSNTLPLYINQYNNQVKDDSSVTRTLTLRNANPTFTNFTFKDSNATVAAITGNNQVLVKGQSTLEVKVPSADKMVAIKGATASRYDFAFDGVSNQETYATGDVTSDFTTVATSGTRTIQVTAYDSRSNTTRVSKPVIVYDYAAPTITTTLTRENNFGSDTTITIEGTYTPLTIGGTDKNSPQTGTLQYRYKESDGAFGSWVTKTFTDNGDGTYDVTPFVVSLNNENKYEFEFHIDDEFGTVTTTNSVDVGTPIMFVGQNSGAAAVGINKMPENGALDVEGDIYSNGEKVVTGGTWSSYTPSLTNITASSNVASYTQIGKTVHAKGQINVTGVSGAVTITMPTTINTTIAYMNVGLGRLMDISSGTYYVGIVQVASSTTVAILSQNVSGSYIAQGNLSSSAPFTWASGDIIRWFATYEAA